MTVDYSNASIMADDAPAAPFPSPRGTPVACPDRSARPDRALDDRHHLVITAGRTARLAFDFNLAVSNAVDLGTAS